MTVETLLRTPLHALHLVHGAKMVPFAGYEMPVQFGLGVLKEHLHTRHAAGLFDVSHMGQIAYRGPAEALERVIPANLVDLAPGRQRYGVLTNDAGGIRDDLMVANLGDRFLLIVNAACKAEDFAYLQDVLDGDLDLLDDRGLIALQGPMAETVLSPLVPVTAMRFMDVIEADILGAPAIIARAGYTGEDGFEISVPADRAEAIAEHLLAHDAVEPVGLGARDSLRLEAGLCLMGSDLTAKTSPVEADLAWSIPKVRRTGGARAGGFPGAERILAELESGTTRRRVGLRPEGRAPVRPPAPLFADATGPEVGHVTSGGFGPSIEAPIAMGYVPTELAAPGTTVFSEVRGKRLPLTVTALPFRPPTYKR